MPANFTGSLAISGSLILTGSITTTGGITISGSIDSASFAATASSADNFFVRQNLTASSALFTGSITAQTLVVQTVTSSIVYSSGSNIFGNLVSNVQQFTGSLRVTGSGNHWILGGNLGIGTSSPTRKLTIEGGGTFGATTGASIRLNNTASGRFSIIDMDDSENLNIWGSTDISSVRFYTNSASGTLRMIISSSGNVGIGTSSPNDKLEVNGAIFTTANTVLTTTKGAIFDFNDSQDAGRMLAYKSTGANLLFYTNGSGGGLTERMRIKSSGDIKIVAGNLLGWSDYVANTSGVGITAITSPNENMLFYVSGSERMRINCGGFVKMSNNATYIDSAANYYEMRSSLNNPVLFVWASNASYADDILSVRAERNTTNNTFKAIRYYNQTAATDRFYVTDGGGGYFYCSVGIGTTSTSTEANLFLGAQGTVEGGQLVLQKGTSCNCATHLDNYQNTFRVLSGTDTATTTVNLQINHTNQNFYRPYTAELDKVISMSQNVQNTLITVTSSAFSTIRLVLEYVATRNHNGSVDLQSGRYVVFYRANVTQVSAYANETLGTSFLTWNVTLTNNVLTVQANPGNANNSAAFYVRAFVVNADGGSTTSIT